MNILIVGFSVTEMPQSYTANLRWLNAARGSEFNFFRCGIGGIGSESLAHLIDPILDQYKQCTHVIFEIATSTSRPGLSRLIATNPNNIRIMTGQIEALVISCWSRGMVPGFLNLPRLDVNYADDFLESAIAQVCAFYNVDYLSVSQELFMRDIDATALFADVVHPNVIGAELFAEKALNLASRMVAKPAKTREIKPLQRLRFVGVPLAPHVDLETRAFSRHGFSAQYAHLPQDLEVTFTFPEPLNFRGVAVLCGPRSGIMRIRAADSVEIMAYDPYCYYERLMILQFDLGVTDRFTASISSQVPSIELLKGEKDSGPRSVGMFYALGMV